MPELGHLFFDIVEDRIRLFDLLLRLGFHNLTQAIAHTIEHLGHRTGGGQERLTICLLYTSDAADE